MTRTTEAWIASNGAALKLWKPSRDQADLLEWWWPLHRLLRRMWFDGAVLDVHLEDFQLVGCVPRSGSADIWVFRPAGMVRDLFIDVDGGTYEHRPLPSDPSRGRFTRCDLIRAFVDVGIYNLPEPDRTLQDRVAGQFDAHRLVPLPGRAGQERIPIPRAVRHRSSRCPGDGDSYSQPMHAGRYGPDPDDVMNPASGSTFRERIDAADARYEQEQHWDEPTEGRNGEGLSDCERVESEIASRSRRASWRRPGDGSSSNPARVHGAADAGSGRPRLRLVGPGSNPRRSR